MTFFESRQEDNVRNFGYGPDFRFIILYLGSSMKKVPNNMMSYEMCRRSHAIRVDRIILHIPGGG